MVWTIQTALDEGTREPFIARLLAGACALRDEVIGGLASDGDREQRRLAFDKLYDPVLNDMFTMRRTTRALVDLVNTHREKITSGKIVGRQQNAIEIHESINLDLKDLLARFLSSAVRAAKSLQNVTAYLGLDIAAFFAKESNFQSRMVELEAGGHNPLVAYLRLARAGWSQKLIERRNDLEHNGWALSDVKYPPVSATQVAMVEPQIDGVEVSLWVEQHHRHVLAFVEDVLVYAFKSALRSPNVVIVEIPVANRDPEFPQRFRIGFPAFERVAAWSPRYDPAGFR